MSVNTERLVAALDGRYRIERELGSGGMATVYLAHDLKHERKVAVKVLKPELAAVLGAERFVVEIKTTAALQHPHILPLFDSGEADGFLYYVMPFIDGETLRAKLDRESQLGVDEAVRMTGEIAGALHYAHEHGVIHRDIKPENILLQDGRPMVADFGIALAVSAAAGGRMTETGLSLGTPHYMSPEQATAEKEITARSDQYSLASVLFEMLTGDPPHTGATAQQIIMKIITEPAADVASLRKSVPPNVADAVARALEKLPADRFPSTQAFAAALTGDGPSGRTGSRARVAAVGASSATTGRWRALALASVAIAVVSVGFALTRARPSAGTTSGERIEFAYRPIASQADWPYVSISDDGRIIAQVVRDSDGIDHVALRTLGSADMAIVPGTAGARDPQLSPDGASILFAARGQGLRIPLRGGTPTSLSDSSSNAGVAFLPDGRMIISSNQVGLRVITADGRFERDLTTVDSVRGEFSHWYPQTLPGGRAVIFNSYATPIERSRIEAVDLESGERTVLVDGAIYARYVETGHLLFARNNAVYAVPFDADELRVLGREVPVVENVAMNVTNGTAGYAVSRNGTLVYVRASQWRVESRVLWADRTGATTPAVPEPGGWTEPRLSPDGRWIALTRVEPQSQVWLYDTSRRVLSQLTRSEGVSFSSAWTPDSRALLLSREVPQYDIYRQPIDGSAASVVLTTREDKFTYGVSPDLRHVVFMRNKRLDQVAVVEIRTGEERLIDERPTNQRTADISPDGRWLAYGESNAAGRFDVFVRAFNGSGGRRQVSADGGDQPRFTKGGREIVYRKGDAVYAVPFDPASGEAGTPALLFRARDAGRTSYGRTVGYDVTPDGTRFLIVSPIERPDVTPNVVVLNWFEELQRMVPR